MFFQSLPGYLGGWKRLKQPMGNSFHDVNRHPSFRFSFFRLNISRLMGKSTPKKQMDPAKMGNLRQTSYWKYVQQPNIGTSCKSSHQFCEKICN
jgi:hypothetical protein